VVVDAESEESLLVITGIKGRINRAVWGPLNRTIITAGEDATIRIWDTEVSSDYLFALVLPTIGATSTHH
jgi:WD40 repeat protein